MGLLSQGSPLNWEETKKYADHVRKHGIIQFLNIYNKVKERQKDVLKWGDEVRNPLSLVLFPATRVGGGFIFLMLKIILCTESAITLHLFQSRLSLVNPNLTLSRSHL